MRVVLAFGVLLYLKGDFDKAYAFTSKWHDRLLSLATRPVCKMGVLMWWRGGRGDGAGGVL